MLHAILLQVYRMNANARAQVKIRCQAANTYAFFIVAGLVLCAGGDYWLEIGSSVTLVVCIA